MKMTEQLCRNPGDWQQSSLYALERSSSPSAALESLTDQLRSFRLNTQWQYEDSHFEVSHVVLTNYNDEVVARGSGKGANHKLGALAEALEHYACSIHDDQIEMIPIEIVAEQPVFASDYFLATIARREKGELIRAVEFQNIRAGSSHWIPAGYVAPSSYMQLDAPIGAADTYLSKYCTNTGAALGLTADDSLLHGINEVIERHYESLLCQNILGVGPRIRWATLADCTDQDHKASLIAAEYDDVITLVTDTPFDRYVAFSLLKHDHSCTMAHLGAGCSAFLSLAVRRSIDELAQCLKLSDHVISDSDILAEERNTRSTLIDRGLDILASLGEQAAKNVAVRYSYKQNRNWLGSSTQQLRGATAALGRSGYDPLSRVIGEHSGMHVTQTFVPGFDHFFVIRCGHLVAPLVSYQDTTD